MFTTGKQKFKKKRKKTKLNFRVSSMFLSWHDGIGIGIFAKCTCLLKEIQF